MKRGLLLLFVMAALCALVAPVAAASPTRLKLLSGEVSTFAADDRYLVYDTNYGRALRVLDTHTGKARSISLPVGCQVSINGRTLSASGHRAALGCDGSATLLMNLRTGSEEPVGPPSVGSVVYSGYASRLGTYWMLGEVRCATLAGACVAARNVITGEERLITDPPVAGIYADPNTPDLSPVSFCSPWDAQARTHGEPPGARWQQWIRLGGLSQGTIVRCGSHAAHLLTPEGNIHNADQSLTGGWTTWGHTMWCRKSTREHAYAYEPSTRRTWDWTIPKINGRARCLAQTAHTNHTLVVAVDDELHADESIEFNTYRLLIARRPG